MAEIRSAHDVMVTDIVTLLPETHVIGGIAKLLKHQVSGAPVLDDDKNYLGVFSEKCCMRVLAATAQAAIGNGDRRGVLPCAKEFMKTKLITLTPEEDVFDAIGYLLKNRISGAPVIDQKRRFLGVFSEKTAMSVLIASAYDQLPTARVEGFMNPDPKRTIAPDMGLMDVAKIFLDTPYRRLPVLSDGRLVGQVSRRDVLHAEHHLAKHLRNCDTVLLNLPDNDENVSAKSNGISHLHDTNVAAFMDTVAKTISEDIDMLAIAQIFLNTPYRRLVVVRENKLVGQVSRRDLLCAALQMLDSRGPKDKSLVYLSSITQVEHLPFA